LGTDIYATLDAGDKDRLNEFIKYIRACLMGSCEFAEHGNKLRGMDAEDTGNREVGLGQWDGSRRGRPGLLPYICSTDHLSDD
jgi:hypothetical protein